jgi:hypothetical protein
MGGMVSSRIYTSLYQRKTMNQGMAKISCKDSPCELHEVDERLICVKCGKKLIEEVISKEEITQWRP